LMAGIVDSLPTSVLCRYSILFAATRRDHLRAAHAPSVIIASKAGVCLLALPSLSVKS